jgi:hypothetical protein
LARTWAYFAQFEVSVDDVSAEGVSVDHGVNGFDGVVIKAT